MFRTLIAAVALAAPPLLAHAQTQPPPNAMSRQELREEVTRLRAIVQGRAVLPRRPQGCASPESRQFDFWLGEWERQMASDLGRRQRPAHRVCRRGR